MQTCFYINHPDKYIKGQTNLYKYSFLLLIYVWQAMEKGWHEWSKIFRFQKWQKCYQSCISSALRFSGFFLPKKWRNPWAGPLPVLAINNPPSEFRLQRAWTRPPSPFLLPFSPRQRSPRRRLGDARSRRPTPGAQVFAGDEHPPTRYAHRCSSLPAARNRAPNP